ncbi:MAG: hypothetical protein MI867_28245 [Pseudomonadales bacterium]|nr:hypothetical protein [Pseudomonadales bacterium]
MRITSLALVLFSFILAGCSNKPNLSNLPLVDSEFSCEADSSISVPEDPAEAGPWPVGVRTVSISNGSKADLTAEVWYPGSFNSQLGAEKVVYDLRQFLPDDDAALIPDDGGLVQECDCYANLPVDLVNGPYPVIVFTHGTAAFRTASVIQATHWVSRGFIVITADNPKIWLKDMKANLLSAIFANQAQDTVSILEAVHDVNADLNFLQGMDDATRIGLGGHSAGARAVSALGAASGVRVVVPMAGGDEVDDTYAQQVLFMGSEKDNVVQYSAVRSGYNANTLPKRFVGIANTGHLTYTELCSLGSEFGGVIPLVESFGVDVDPLFLRLGTDGCGSEFLSPETGWDIVNAASTIAYEEVLKCKGDSSELFYGLEARFGSDIFEIEGTF